MGMYMYVYVYIYMGIDIYSNKRIGGGSEGAVQPR